MHVDDLSQQLPITHLNRPQARISVGAGLVALDWLLIGKDRVRPNESYAGGSCGNVMAILAFLGWESYPVARLGTDHRTNRLIKDLERWDVHTDFLLKQQYGTTPVIIVRLREQPDGSFARRYEWKDPRSKNWLPQYRPLPKRLVAGMLPKLPAARIFYFDRAEASVLLLAEKMRDRGSIVFFEPSSTRNNHLFSKCLAVSDIVKYSAEVFADPLDNPNSQSPKIEIQTNGDRGLRYRVKSNSAKPGGWHLLAPFQTGGNLDSTGCGDWCSAGIITKLCETSRTDFLRLSIPEIQSGIQFGQALAAVNCEHLGARGPMYHLDRNQVLSRVQKLCET